MEALKVANTVIEEERIYTPKEQAQINKQKEQNKYRRKQRLKLFFTALIISSIFHLIWENYFISLIPLVLHCCLLFYSYAVIYYGVKQKENYWRAYVKKFGDKNGNIPAHVRMTHKKLIMQGHKIDVSPRNEREVSKVKPLTAVK